MSLSETEETRQFSFAPFAAHPFYTHINRSLVQQALGAAALGAAVYQAGQELGVTTVPRLWLQLIATKVYSHHEP